jgi:alkylmercury lyase
LLDTPAFERLSQDLLSRLPAVSPAARDVGVALYRLLAEGKEVTATELAGEMGRNQEEIASVLQELHSLVHFEGERIIGFGGLAVRQMAHKLVVNGRQLYTWCAWDSLFITHLLGVTTHIESACPQTAEPIKLEVAPDGIVSVDPADTVMSILVPASDSFQEDAAQTMMSFCHFVHFFASPSAADAWVTRYPGTALLPLDKAFALGVRLNQSRWGMQ